jgi:hypothetical protein
MDERRLTPAQWSEVFGLEQIPMTREEYLAGLQARSLGVLIEILHAVKHTEGMQSSYDDFLARYAQVIGVPFIPSEEVQTALREHRLALQLENSNAGGMVPRSNDLGIHTSRRKCSDTLSPGNWFRL